MIETSITEYRLKPASSAFLSDPHRWPLTAAALCDRLSDGISMVYSFYEPTDWIEGSRKMNYKTRFLPQERLGPNGWERV